MIKKIDVFLPPENKSRYNVIEHFTKKFADALKKAGIRCRLLRAQRENPEPFLQALMNDPPDCTLSFNGLLPDEKGRFFCDMIKIPHVACLIDSPTQYLSLIESPYTIITLPDSFSVDFVKGLNAPNVLFMPHAVESDLSSTLYKNYKYDVVMLSSCIDFVALEEKWALKYPKEICDVLKEAASIALNNKEASATVALVQSINQEKVLKSIDVHSLNFPELIDQIEMYVKGKDRVELIRAIKTADVHIFGSSVEDWKKYIGDKKNVHFHEPVSYEVALEIMNQSKIVLSSSAWLKNGTHERILAAMASYALVITNENIYMSENFINNQNVVLYPMGKWDAANEKIDYYLSNDAERLKIAEKGHDYVLKYHTWDNRVKLLLKEIPLALENIRQIETK